MAVPSSVFLGESKSPRFSEERCLSVTKGGEAPQTYCLDVRLRQREDRVKQQTQTADPRQSSEMHVGERRG